MSHIRLKLALMLLALVVVFPASGCSGPGRVDMPVVLFSDLGTEDFGAPVLKGIIYSSYRDARVIDGTHNLPAFDVPAGAYVMHMTAREFPEGVVFIGAVVPGIPAGLRYLVLTTNRNQIFVLPDNGLLTHVAKETGIKSIVQITNQGLFDRPIEGLSPQRILGRVGALVASGYDPNRLGPPVIDPKTFEVQEGAIVNGRMEGTIVFLDHFGNCVTNIPREIASNLGLTPGDALQITIADNRIAAKFGSGYASVPVGDAVVLFGSLDFIQLSVNMDSFAKVHKIKTGAKVIIEKTR